LTHTIPGPPPGAGAWLAGDAFGVAVCVAGGCVDEVDAGAGAAGAAEPVEVLELAPPAPLELLLAAPPPLAVPPAAAAVAALSIPPCPLQAPRPPCGDVEPSLQVTGLLVSAKAFAPGSPSSAAAANVPQTKEA
jgi:hypothetical protein